MWQDITIVIANIFLSYGLVIQVYQNFKNKVCAVATHTIVSMFVGMTMVAVAIFGVGLLYSGILNSLIALLWFIVLLQKIIYRRK